MKIKAYKDSGFSSLVNTFIVQINPASIQREKGINYSEDDTLGTAHREMKYVNHNEEKLSFKIVMDDTGVIPDTTQKSIFDRLKDLYKTVYTLNSDSHEPHYLVITWGDLSFKGRLASLSEEHTLFSPQGFLLRVTISFSFIGHLAKSEANKVEGKCSPDLSRVIVLKAGESIAQWCCRLYGDPSYCLDVADYNGLSSFRNVEPGTSLLFPPLTRDGRVTR